ncbi:hypothetical protein SLE2022_334740 [Rubroshorea leprosula]
MEQDCSKWTCNHCGNVGMIDEGDGYFYCARCYSQADDVMDTGVADEDFMVKGDQTGALYSANHKRQRHQPVTPVQRISQFNPQTQQFWSQMTEETNDHYHDQQNRAKEVRLSDDVGPVNPSDFGSFGMSQYSYEDYYKELRNRHVMGVQIMLQAQCESLVEKFNVNPLICGIVGPIWLRFVASTGILDDEWADHAIHESEIQKSGEAENIQPRAKYRSEPHNIYGQRALIIWYKSLRKKVPLSCSLAVSFLGCHVLREAILPTDIVKWSVEGKLTYLDAFVELEKRIGRGLPPFPFNLNQMFRPSHVVSAQKLESQAAQIAQSIGLNLPPVNFYAIALRYLNELSLPVEKILPCACQIYEWVMPPDLWLSTHELKLPTRICLMSILIVAIRILYNISGFGIWERSLETQQFPTKLDNAGKVDPTSSPKVKDLEADSTSPYSVDDLGTNSVKLSSHAHKSELDAAELLCKLEARYSEIKDTYDYSRNLPTYLQFCKDVIFAGLEPPLEFYQEEQSLIDQFWEFYQNEKDSESHENGRQDRESRRNEGCAHSLPGENIASDQEYYRSPSNDNRTFDGGDSHQRSMDVDDVSQHSHEPENSEAGGEVSVESLKERAIRRMKRDMEENRFCYIPPRAKPKRFDYLHYVRKKDEGAMTYVAHADYYILLRACARVAHVDIRIMHGAVLGFERRLGWTEAKIDQCLNVRTPQINCQFCSDMPENSVDDNTMQSDRQV